MRKLQITDRSLPSNRCSYKVMPPSIIKSNCTINSKLEGPDAAYQTLEGERSSQLLRVNKMTMKHNYSGEISETKAKSCEPRYRQNTKSSARARAYASNQTVIAPPSQSIYEPPRCSTLIFNAESEKRHWMLRRGKNNMVYYDNDQLKTIKTYFE